MHWHSFSVQSEVHWKWHCTKRGRFVVIFLSFWFHPFLTLAECFCYWNLLNIALKLKQPFVLLCLKQGSISEVLSPKTLSEITLNLYLCLEAEGWILFEIQAMLFIKNLVQISWKISCALKGCCRLSRLYFRSVMKCCELIYKSTYFPILFFFLSL